MNMTRNCLDPWMHVMICADGGVSHCCVSGSTDNIYNYSLDEMDLNTILNNKDIISIRESLLTGDLKGACINCSHRVLVSVEELQEKVKEIYSINKMEVSSDSASGKYLVSSITEGAIVEPTSKCNFRCSYCNHSLPELDSNWKNINIDYLPVIFSQLNDRGLQVVTMNGYGETSCLKGWHEICDGIISNYPNIKVEIISNFGRLFTNDEVEVLAKFNSIMISCDSVDPELYSKLRKNGDIRTLLYNIQNIRTKAFSLGYKIPEFGFSCVVSNLNINELSYFVDFGIVNGIKHFDFCNLVINPGTLAEKELCKLIDLPLEEILHARDILSKIQKKLNSYNYVCNFVGDLFELLDDKYKQFVNEDDEKHSSVKCCDKKICIGDTSELIGNYVHIGDERLLKSMRDEKLLYIINRLRDKRIIGFGAGDKYVNDQRKLNLNLSYLVDNNSNKCGKTLEGKIIYTPDKIMEEDINDIYIVVFSKAFYDEISLQLKKLGFMEYINFYSFREDELEFINNYMNKY